MPQSEQEVFEEITRELKAAQYDDDITGHILDSLSTRLPDGEAKDFFQRVEQILVSIYEIAQERDEERVDEALEAVRAAKAMLKDKTPNGVPQEIVETYRNYLGYMMALLKMIKGVIIRRLLE